MMDAESSKVSDENESAVSEQLFRAARDGDLSKVKYLVEVRQVDPNSCREDDGTTPLHRASRFGHLTL